MSEVEKILLNRVKLIEDDSWSLIGSPMSLIKELEAIITTQKQEAYRQGYNDNARNCYCDSPGATEGVLPHKHLMDDGESHDIRPEVKSIITTKRGEI